MRHNVPLTCISTNTVILRALTLEKKKNRNRFSTIKSWLLFKLAQHVASFSVDDTLGIEGGKKIKLSHIQCLQTK